ncbi:MAG: AAA family ATPase [Bacteroidales bacterium]|nr:AAA family ATPase [Bacteroidales bacterium]
MEHLLIFSQKRIKETSLDFFRYKYADIMWQGRMFGIVGPRGVGKTTMMLQYAKTNLNIDKTLYISADQIYFSHHSLLEVADRFSKMGGLHLLIDEIHHYPNWSIELKEIFETYSDLQIIFSGSSILDICKGAADLSRRAPIYEIQGLSFREYLKLFHNIDVPVFSLEQVLSNEAQIPGITHPLPLFSDYLQHGYYPFGRDVNFDQELLQVVNRTMETDIPQYASLNVSAGRRLKQLMMVVAESVPFKPQMTTLAQVTGISRNDLPDYLYFMERAGMIAQLRDTTMGVRGLGKLEKIYVDNTNLAFVLTDTKPDVGNLRETFFLNQTRVNHVVRASKISDFEIEGKTFEIGGKSKGKKQILGASDGYVVKDDIEQGYANVIPLFHFGLLY